MVGEGGRDELRYVDPELLATTRRNLPVTVQRRFDVYPDIASLV
jgi:hypothetical protein